MLKNKTAVVTGGTRGIGLAIVKKYLENGASVALSGSRQETVEKALEGLAQYKDRVMGIWPDLCDPEAVAAAFASVKERFGSLIIEKELLAYNETFGGADFIFKVEAEKGGKSVYSNVLSLAFDAAGEKSLQIDGLPAGAKATVTEVYSGSCYEIVTEAQRVQTVDHIIAEGEEGSPQRVRFQNTYDDRPNGGSGIVNHFRYEGNGIWGEPQQQRDSAQ